MFTTISRKFFEMDAPAEVAPSTTSAPSSISLAEMMATAGTKIDTGSSVQEIEPLHTENTQNPPSQEQPPVATTNDAPTIKDEAATPTPQTEPVVEVTPQIVEPQTVVVPTWQEVLKSQQPDAVLNELGFDDKVVSLANELKGFDKIDFFTNLIREWKEKGDLTGYLRELSTDYLKMPAEEVMRNQLRQEYPRATEQQLNILYNKKIVEAYNLNSVDETEVEEGKLLLEAEADKYRDKFVDNQQKYLAPKPPEKIADAPTVDPIKERELREQQDIEVYKSYIDKDPYSKSILTEKALIIGEGEERFKFPVDVNQVTEVLLDKNKWANNLLMQVKKQDGTIEYVPDIEKQYLIAGVNVYGKNFLTALATHFKSVGGKTVIEPIENAKQPSNSTPSASEAEPKTMAEAMAKGGRRVG